MDTLSAFAMAEANRNKPHMVFDWDKAAALIAERPTARAEAGLSGDWEYTGGVIYRDSAPVPSADTYVYLCSTWATPELSIDGEVVECWRYRTSENDWDADTYWPETAVAILRAGGAS